MIRYRGVERFCRYRAPQGLLDIILGGSVPGEPFLKTYESDLTADLLPTFNYLPLDSNGWSTFTPSADSYVIYVNSATGNDGTATPYTYGDGSAFTDWFADEGQVAFATLEAAWTQLRPGYPDYIVCRNGQVHEITTTLSFVDGRSLSERLIVTGYGDGDRAFINLVGTDRIIFNIWTNTSYWGIIGIEGGDTRRNPNSPDFIGDLLNYNARFISLNAFADGHIKGGLIENCQTNYIGAMTSALYTFRGQITDVIFRRNGVFGAYSATESHQQGAFLGGGSFLLEENFFDKNGWSDEVMALTSITHAEPSEFKHNLYGSHLYGTIIRRNIFSRSSSMGIKTTANSTYFQIAASLDGVETEMVLFENLRDDFPNAGTFILKTSLDSGDVGYKETPVTFTARTGNALVIDQDFTSDPYDIGAYAAATFNYVSSFDLDINENLLIDDEIGISYGGNFQNDYDDITARYKRVRVQGNILSEIGKSQVQGESRVVAWGLTCSDNEDSITSENLILKTTNPLVTDRKPSTFGGVQIDTQQSNNISLLGGVLMPSAELNYANASALSDADFVNADANTLTYLTSIGETATYESFYEKLREQSKLTWDSRYTAPAINSYLRKQLALVDEIKVLQDATNATVVAEGLSTNLRFDVIANTRVSAQWYLAADNSPVDGLTNLVQPITPTTTPTDYYCIAQDEYGNSVQSSAVTVAVVTPVNKLSFTEDFTNAAWIKDLSSITANSATAPDGEMTADLITGSATNGEQRVRQVVATTGAPEVLSIYVEPIAGSRYFGFRATDGGAVTTIRFDIDTLSYFGGGTVDAFMPTITAEPNGYYRLSIVFQNRTSTSLNFNIMDSVGYLVSTDGLQFNIWGAMLTDGNELTPYVAG